MLAHSHQALPTGTFVLLNSERFITSCDRQVVGRSPKEPTIRSKLHQEASTVRTCSLTYAPIQHLQKITDLKIFYYASLRKLPPISLLRSMSQY